jgi:hypothetical protein
MDISSNIIWQNLENRLLNAINNYTDQILPEPNPPIAADPIPPRRQPSPSPERQSRNVDNEYEMLNDMIYYYSQNIREYNANIRELIYRVEDYQTSRRFRNHNTNRHRHRYSNNYFNYRENPFRMYYHTQWIPTNLAGTNNATPALLTREEIARSTITYGFIDEMIIRDASGEITNVCPISLEPLQIGDVICEIRGCGHKFKRPNLMTWLNRNSNCPVCRYNLRTPLPTEPTSAENSEEPLTNEEHDELENEENQEEEIEDPSGNQNSTNTRRIQDSLTQIFQNILQGVNVESFSDGSANLLYEFEFPLYNNYNENTERNDEIEHDEEVD